MVARIEPFYTETDVGWLSYQASQQLFLTNILLPFSTLLTNLEVANKPLG